MNNDAGNGLILVQHSPDFAVKLDEESPFHGWLFYRHPDGQFVTKRKLTSWEITQAEDQRDGNIIIDGGKSAGYRALVD